MIHSFYISKDNLSECLKLTLGDVMTMEINKICSLEDEKTQLVSMSKFVANANCNEFRISWSDREKKIIFSPISKNSDELTCIFKNHGVYQKIMHLTELRSLSPLDVRHSNVHLGYPVVIKTDHGYQVLNTY